MHVTGLEVATLAAAIAAVAAVGSWRAAVKASNAAAALARIEAQRRRAELTPEFVISLAERGAGFADLRITLTGPDGLTGLDAVTVRILDERWKDHGRRIVAGGPSADDIAKHVFGPWEFNPGAADQVASNRVSVPRAYSRERGQDWDSLSLVVTAPPYWVSGMNAQQWLRQYDGQPLRLLLTCRAGADVWVLPHDAEMGG